jgi:hypothetical protein
MIPDQLLQAWVVIIQDVFGHQGQFRKTRITDEEWQRIEERIRLLRTMNKEVSDGRAESA